MSVEIPEKDDFLLVRIQLVCMSIMQWMRKRPKRNEISQLPLEDEFLRQLHLPWRALGVGISITEGWRGMELDVWLTVTLMFENWYIPEFTHFFFTPNASNASKINHLYCDLWVVSSGKQWKPCSSRAGSICRMEAKQSFLQTELLQRVFRGKTPFS